MTLIKNSMSKGGREGGILKQKSQLRGYAISYRYFKDFDSIKSSKQQRENQPYRKHVHEKTKRQIKKK